MKKPPATSSFLKKKVPLVKIAIVDDDPAVRANLSRTIGVFEGFQCVGSFGSGQEALTGVPACAPDVVLMDINMPNLNGIECASQLKATNDDIEIIMLTVYEDTDSIFNALSAGASGYLLKRATSEELREAIQQVQSGGSPMSSHIARKVVQSFRKPAATATATDPKLEKLTQREQQILEHLAKGSLYKEIADSLEISYETVNNHIRHIYQKLHIRSRSQAVATFFAGRPGSLPRQ